MILDGTIVDADISASAGIVDTKLDTIATAGKVSNSATTATNANTASAIVARDGSGNFSAGTITAALTGAASANVLKAGDTMTGVLAVTAGTAALPAITPSGDPNTGIFSPGADQVAISTNGTGRLFVDASGNVGLGTSSPDARLQVNQGISNGTTSFGVYPGVLQIYNNQGIVNSDASLKFVHAFNAGDVATGEIGTVKTDFFNSSAYRMFFRTGGTERLTISSAGNVGIGTTSPSSNGNLTVLMPGDNGTGVVVRAQATGGNGSQTALVFEKPDGTINSRIVSDIGTGYVDFQHAGSGSFIFTSNSAERARIDSSGRLLVGTSSDSGGALLQVNGNRIRIATANTPASAGATGTTGEIAWDADYIYVCTATNTWKRTAISTW
jgi:hypothetical protein